MWLSEEKRPGLKKKMADFVAANLKKRVEEADLTFPVDNDNGDFGTSAETEVTGAVQCPHPDFFQEHNRGTHCQRAQKPHRRECRQYSEDLDGNS